jgi:hypothetical protein
MTLWSVFWCWLVINELFVIYRMEVYLLQAKQKLGSNRSNGLPSA